MTRGHDGSAESLAKQRAREVPVPPPGGDGDDLAGRLVHAAETALARHLGGYGEPDDTWETEARAAAVAVLRTLDTAICEWPNGRSYVPGRDPLERMREENVDAWLSGLADEVERGSR